MAEFIAKGEKSPFQAWKDQAASYVSSLLTFADQSRRADSEIENETGRESQLIDQFLKKVKIEPVRNSRLVKVNFDSHYPDLSTEVVNTHAAAYIQQSLENRFTATEQARKWLTQQLDDLKGKVERTNEMLQSFGSKHDIISLEEKENITMRRLTDLNEALTKAEAERMAKEVLQQVNGRILGVVVNRINIRRNDYGAYYYRYHYYYGDKARKRKKELPAPPEN